MSNFFEKIGLVERVDNNIPQNYPEEHNEGSNMEEYANYIRDYNSSDLSSNLNEDGESFINTVYIENNINPQNTIQSSNSIFKVQEIGSKLPSTLPTQQKQESVLGLLDSFGLSVYDLLTDGENRINILNDALLNANNSFDCAISKMEQQIEEAKQLISDNNSKIIEVKEKQESYNNSVEKEIQKINALCDFISVEGGQS